MAVADPGAGTYRFGRFEFDPRTGELSRDGVASRLAPQPARLLTVLLSRAGELVPRDDLRGEIWDDRTTVDFDLGLNYCLGRLRAALGDAARDPRFIETVPRRGYRFIAPVTPGRACPTLAVLPFDNLGRDREQEYLADGVTDALITELGKIGSLRVISRQSVLHLRGSQRSIGDLARELRVAALVEGAVLCDGPRLRITAQLVQARPERHLWAESFEGDLQDLLGLLGRVARAVARAVAVVLTPEEEARFARRVEVKAESQVAYLKARFHLGKWSRQDMEKGLAHLHEAIATDPQHAAAWAELASCMALLGYWGHLPWRVAYPKAKQAATRALALEPDSSSAHVAAAWTRQLLDWDCPGCEQELLRALELNPSNVEALVYHSAFLLETRGDRQAALREAREALRLDPVSPLTNTAVAWIYLFAGEPEAAAEQASRSLEMYPDALQAIYVLGWACLAQGRHAEAVAFFERARAISADAMTLGFLGHAYGRAGNAEAARGLLGELLRRHAQEPAPVKSLVAIYVGLGEHDRAFEQIDQAFADGDGAVFSLRIGPQYGPLANDPRFASYLARLSAVIGRSAPAEPALDT